MKRSYLVITPSSLLFIGLTTTMWRTWWNLKEERMRGM